MKECDTTMHFHVLPMLVMLLNLASGINCEKHRKEQIFDLENKTVLMLRIVPCLGYRMASLVGIRTVQGADT